MAVMAIDLHTHSTASDGTDSPAELIAAAVAAGLSTLAITDHDTTGGWQPAEQARPDSLCLIRGAEFSTEARHDGRRAGIHLLGYLFDPADAAIVAEQQRLRKERLHRGLGIVEGMVAAGLPISVDQVLTIAGGAPVGRPHIGRALVQSGVVPSVDVAFEYLLAGRGPFYRPKKDTDVVAAVGLIRRAGGAPVIGHPRGRGEQRVLNAEFLGLLVDAGLVGLEVDHPDHSEADRAELQALAQRFGLLTTGSSDYHGSNKKLRLGQQTTAPDVLASLIELTSGVVPPLGTPG